MPGTKPPPAIPHAGLHIAEGIPRMGWLKQHTRPVGQFAALEHESDTPSAHCPLGAQVTTMPATT